MLIKRVLKNDENPYCLFFLLFVVVDRPTRLYIYEAKIQQDSILTKD